MGAPIRFDAMAEIGRASAGREADVLAHDFNNLLNVILCANEALADLLPEGSAARELACLCQDAAERGGEMVRRMLDGSAPSTGVCDGAGAVLATAHRARLATEDAVTVEVRLAEAPLLCAADLVDLEAALLNLCVNAGHATPNGGVVTIFAEAVDLRGRMAERLSLTSGCYVALSVRDNGAGMTPDILARATEPHFTTRRARGGSGLGLSGVDAFARRSGGGFDLTSRPGRGTTATLYLPRE
jgi:signal transduction histidine kinase